jgi:hypothetical protein
MLFIRMLSRGAPGLRRGGIKISLFWFGEIFAKQYLCALKLET